MRRGELDRYEDGARWQLIFKPIRTKADYQTALDAVERLWGAKSGTPKGDRLDVLATLIEVCEARHFPMDSPDMPIPLPQAAAV